ncbi:hypothetical protein QJS66_09665 [Kocuria rhizophila]|nr:hypothetical protein QJS66_09665 [Kocuria rhizophila]
MGGPSAPAAHHRRRPPLMPGAEEAESHHARCARVLVAARCASATVCRAWRKYERYLEYHRATGSAAAPTTERELRAMPPGLARPPRGAGR